MLELEASVLELERFGVTHRIRSDMRADPALVLPPTPTIGFSAFDREIALTNIKSFAAADLQWIHINRRMLPAHSLGTCQLFLHRTTWISRTGCAVCSFERTVPCDDCAVDDDLVSRAAFVNDCVKAVSHCGRQGFAGV